MLASDDATPLLSHDAAPLDFALPPELEAAEPPEARGLARDEVRLIVSHIGADEVIHTTFREIGSHLRPGDLLVINTSGTRNAALDVTRADGTALELHLSTQLPDGRWVVELRRATDKGTLAFFAAQQGETLRLRGGGGATLHTPYAAAATPGAPTRLWVATLRLPLPLDDYLTRHGFPIRYSYVRAGWPLSYYQPVYATEPGSPDMPSAGPAFTPQRLPRLVARRPPLPPLR